MAHNNHTIDDPAELERRATESVAMFDEVEGCMFSPQFSPHICSEDTRQDITATNGPRYSMPTHSSMFKRNGLFDKKTADSFRTNILMRGGTEHPMTLYKRFRGTGVATIDAPLQRDGIQPEEQPSMPQPGSSPRKTEPYYAHIIQIFPLSTSSRPQALSSVTYGARARLWHNATPFTLPKPKLRQHITRVSSRTGAEAGRAEAAAESRIRAF